MQGNAGDLGPRGAQGPLGETVTETCFDYAVLDSTACRDFLVHKVIQAYLALQEKWYVHNACATCRGTAYNVYRTGIYLSIALRRVRMVNQDYVGQSEIEAPRWESGNRFQK